MSLMKYRVNELFPSPADQEIVRLRKVIKMLEDELAWSHKILKEGLTLMKEEDHAKLFNKERQ